MKLSICLAILLAAGTAAADPAGDALVVAVDTALNRAKTNYFEFEATTIEPGRAEKKLALSVHIKGEQRLTEFSAPADLKGTKVLILSPTEMYAYLPAFGKVRRIASHTTDQSAFGLAFSQDDLANQRYSGDYTATIASDGDKETKLVLVARPGGKAAYAKIEMVVLKDLKLPSEFKYFNEAGKLVKTETRTGYACEGDVCAPGTLEMVDHTKSDMSSKMVRKTWKVNQPFADDLLSKRNLDR